MDNICFYLFIFIDIPFFKGENGCISASLSHSHFNTHLLIEGTCSCSENTNKWKGIVSNRFLVERGASERVRSWLSYLRFTTRKGKDHLLLLPCLLTLIFLLFHVPLSLWNLKFTALSWKFSNNFALLCYSTSAINLFPCKPACFLLELQRVVSNVPSSCLCGFKSGTNY